MCSKAVSEGMTTKVFVNASHDSGFCHQKKGGQVLYYNNIWCILMLLNKKCWAIPVLVEVIN
jgi:hypothetical protein